jgi:hypothetical protein
VASSAKAEQDQDAEAPVCLSCGVPLRETLRRLGSLRCVDCRAEDKPLDPKLVRSWHERGAQL